MKKYKIENDKLTVELTSLGGTFSSIRNAEGKEYLWQGDAGFWSGQAPICFPICGSLRNNTAETIDGKTISMPRHGIVKNREFELVEAAQNSITFRLESDGQLKEQYPYDFSFETSYVLHENTIHITYRVTNNGDVRIPYTMGGHTGFKCPLDEGEKYTDYVVEFDRPEQNDVPTPVAETALLDTKRRMPIPQEGRLLRLSHDLFLNDLLCYDHLKSSVVTLKHKEEEKGVRVIFPELPYLVLWSDGGNYLCIEPWSGTCTAEDEDDIYDHKPGVAYVKPGQKGEIHFAYEIF
ncbi:MAG: aldose 1-epimerase family protein [Lachnospiraceae bacterium]|nr:aldose 1-epimerase family protein [Lachnospiraceae bacterium]